MRGQRPTACIWACCIIIYRNIYGLVSIFDPNNSVPINDTDQHHITKPSRQRLEIAPPTVSCITSFYIFYIKWLIFPFFLFELLLDFFFLVSKWSKNLLASATFQTTKIRTNNPCKTLISALIFSPLIFLIKKNLPVIKIIFFFIWAYSVLPIITGVLADICCIFRKMAL